MRAFRDPALLNDFIPYNIEWATANPLMNGDVLLFGDSPTGLLHHPRTGTITNAGMPGGRTSIALSEPRFHRQRHLQHVGAGEGDF